MKNKLYILLFLIFLFSGTALWAQQRATPKSGEGISSFLLRHNRSPKKYYDDFIELNKKKLGKNNVLKVGNHRELLPGIQRLKIQQLKVQEPSRGLPKLKRLK